MIKARNIAAQIEQLVQLDGGLERNGAPGKDRQAQIDDRRIERVNRLGQIHAEGSPAYKASRDADQALGEARADTRNVAAKPQIPKW